MSDSEQTMSPGEARLRADLAGEAFMVGLQAEKWRNPLLEWPVLRIHVAVGDREFVRMRLLVDGYPSRAPGGQLWDDSSNSPQPVGKWPTGGTAGKVFRPDWSPPNQNAPYLPCDRAGLSTHPDWAHAIPDRAWNAARTIDFYLDEIYGELTDARLPTERAA
ncbi:DUF7665 family protein [Kribbella kalugense]|uniref:E2/UBC family protein E n=1 Tax=Kribbella kalugense TaxID=2512221 RepID=A0A4R7ZRK4_9ACTN|nr:hypothetical protein [Kribbella kalugense]TDW19451.1 hypothetical protein EV650_6060 [Kribbella kalugense]